MNSYTPKYAIDNEINMDIWHDRVWVNHNEKIFFVPIWRNGSTEFMYLAEKFGYTLDLNINIKDYVGYTFLRHPEKRISGQLWRARKNTNTNIENIMISLKDNKLIDDHLRTQFSFLEDYNIQYYIDLDNMSLTGHTHIDKIIDHMKQIDNPRSSKDEIEELLNDKYTKIIENYYREDYDLYRNNK